MKKIIVLLLCVIGIKAFAQYSTPCLDYRVPGILTDLGVVQSLILTNWPDYTNTVAKAAAAVTTNDTRQLDFTGADILIADGTETNHPVTKAQLDANSGTTNATGINVAFTPTNYTPDGASVEGHLIGIDAVVASGSGFPLTNNGDLAGFSLTNGGIVQAVSGAFDYVDIGIQLRMTNSESAGELEVVDLMVDADIDDLYYARRNGAWADIDLLGLRGATNALNTRVGVLETSTNALNTRMGAVETATGALNTAVGNLNNSTNALNAKVVALDNSTNALNTRVGTLEGSTNAMNTRLGSLEASTNAINIVANDALPKTFTNTGVMAAMQITGGSPTNGAVWIATNTAGLGKWSGPVSFFVQRTEDFNFSNLVETTIIWDTERYDYGNCMNTTNFVAPVDGVYSFNTQLSISHVSGATPTYARVSIQVNGVNITAAYMVCIANGDCYPLCSLENYYLTSGARVSVQARTQTPAMTNKLSSAIIKSYFSGSLIREIP